MPKLTLLSNMLKTKFKIILSITMGLLFLTLSFQNCSKVNFQLPSKNIIDLKPAVFACRENAGELGDRDLSITGPDTRFVNQMGTFSIANIDDCENLKSMIWSAGDGSPAVESRNLMYRHEYAYPGVYVVRADVIDKDGKVYREYHQVVVADSSCATPAPENKAVCSIESKQLNIMGPSLGWVGQSYNFTVVTPNTEKLDKAEWDFKDATPIEFGANSQAHTFAAAGKYEILVKTSGIYTNTQPLKHTIVIQEKSDTSDKDAAVCPIESTELSSPTKGFVNQKIPIYVNLPKCISDRVASIEWSYGDGQSEVGDQSTLHPYAKKGWYLISSKLIDKDGNVFLTLTRNIEIVDGTPDDKKVEDPQGEGLCTVEGQISTIYGDIYSKKEICGVGDLGFRNDTYKDKNDRKCTKIGSDLVWVSSSKTPELIQKGQCQAQPCAVPTESETECQKLAANDSNLIIVSGKCYIKDGQSKNFFSNQTPKISCDEVQQKRTCNNSVLDNQDGTCKQSNCSGLVFYIYMDCKSGCTGFGADGLIKTNVILGGQTITEPKVCGNGEVGIVDTYEKIVDQTCGAGKVTDSNVHKGKLITAGICPTYKWSETGVSACSANCGGAQTINYSCKNEATGAVVADSFCSKIAKGPASRVCDANPALVDSRVRYDDEESGSCTACPSNQIGIVIGTRQTTITDNYKCVNHAYVLNNTQRTVGAWGYTNYCKDFTTVRCSHDSLTQQGAEGRYAWMQKCRGSVPAVDVFLTRFQNVSYTGTDIWGLQQVNTTLTSTQSENATRRLYPTFINPSNNTSWIAPSNVNDSCAVPANVVVGAVCVSGCATPDQQILAEVNYKPKRLTFLDSLTQKTKSIYVVKSENGLSKPALKTIAVEKWMTELFDSSHEIIVFKMKSGAELKLTTNHPVLTVQGTMKLASEFIVGDKLTKVTGEKDVIVGLNKIKYQGKVYNLFLKSSEPQDNIVVTNGYLNGSAFFQNEGSKYINKQIIRTHLSKGAVKK